MFGRTLIQKVDALIDQAAREEAELLDKAHRHTLDAAEAQAKADEANADREATAKLRKAISAATGR